PNRPALELECQCVMTRESNVVRFPANRTAATTVKAISPVLLAEYQVMNRIRLRRIADIAYNGLLNDREQESLAQIAELFSANYITELGSLPALQNTTPRREPPAQNEKAASFRQLPRLPQGRSYDAT